MPSNIYFLGTAPVRAQVSTAAIASVDGTPANNTFTVTIGGLAVSAIGNTSANQTAADLVTALNASTDVRFSGITWANDSGANIKGTADVSGVAFTAVISKSGGGTGSVTAFGGTGTNTANGGPSDLSDVRNYSTGALPVDGDTLIIENNSIPICWNLDALSTVSLALFRRDQTHTGFIGLGKYLATSSDGATTDTSALEYRTAYLTFGGTSNTMRVEQGQNFSTQSSPNGAGMKLDTQDTVTTITIFNTVPTVSSSSQSLAPIQLKCNATGTNIYVRSGSVGIALGPGEVSTVGSIFNSGGTIQVGQGVTFNTKFQQTAGNSLVSYTALPTVQVYGGTCTLEGTVNQTTLTVYGGTVRDHTSGTTATLNIDRGGYLDNSASMTAKTYTDCNRGVGTIKRNPQGLVFTNAVAYTAPSVETLALP